MPNQTVTIRVQVVGAGSGAKELDQVARKVKEVDQTASLLRKAFAFLGGAFLVKEVIGLADSFTNLQNRLRIVTSSSAELGVVQKKLFDIAQNTRQSYEGTVELYARTATAIKDLGYSTADTIRFTDLLNKTVATSGASTSEAENGIRQLTQALGSGRLGGDELRSVLENLPPVADVIATKLGVTRGELKQLGAEGKLTPKIIVDAFLSAQAQIDANFGKFIPTIGQGFVVLKNAAVQFFGSLASNSGVSEAFARSLIFIANNIELITRLILVLANVLVINFIVGGIQKAITAVIAFSQALTFGNFLTATIQIIYLIVSALVVFSDKLKVTSDGAATLADFFVVAFQTIASALQNVLLPVFNAITEFFSGGLKQASEAGTGLEAISGQANTIQSTFQNAFQAAALSVATFVDTSITVISKFVQLVVLAFQSIRGDIVNPFAELDAIITPFLNKIIGGLETVINLTAGLKGDSQIKIPRLEQLQPVQTVDFAAESAKILQQSQFTGTQDFVKGVFAGAEQRAQDRLANEAKRKADEAKALANLNVPGAPGRQPATAEQQKQQKVLQESLRDYQAQIDLLKQGNDELELRTALSKIEDKLNRPLNAGEKSTFIPIIKEAQSLQEQSRVLQDITGPEQDRIKRQTAINELLNRGLITQDQYNFAIQASGNALDKTLTDMDREIALLQLSKQEYERRKQQQQIELELGRSLNANEVEGLRVRQLTTESLQAQNTLLDQIRGPQQEYVTNLAALNALQERVNLSSDEYSKLLTQINLQYLQTQNTAQAGFTAGLLQVKQQFGDVATLASQTVVNAFGQAEDAIVQFVETGKFDFSSLVDSILSDITRLAIRQSITAPLANLLGGFANSGATGSGGGLFGAIFSGIGSLFGGSSAGVGVDNPLGFAEGGRFRVGGVGGQDSQFVPLRLSPGEIVDITPPGQTPGGGVTVNYYIQTQDADSFRRSQSQIFRDTQTAMQRSTRKLT